MGSLNSLGFEAWQLASSEGVLVTDTANRIVIANPRLKSLLNLDRHPATVQDLLALAGPSAPELGTILQFDPVPVTPRWGSILLHEPVSLRLHWQQTPLWDEYQLVGACTIFRSVTAQAERDLSKQAFLAMISHDLRTPLSAILGFSELLRASQETLSPDTENELLESIIRNAAELNLLTQIALDVMSLEANAEPFETEIVPLDVFLRNWLSDVAHSFSAGQLIFRDSTSPALPARIAPAALRRILQILIEFALSESPAGCPVQISLHSSAARAHIRIQHEAPDLTPADAAAVFDLFRPRDLNEHSRPQLHRVQMYVANLLAERQQGLLTLREEPQAGYQLDLALPLDLSERCQEPERTAG